ncbi:hypothetical protein ACEUAY_16815 [Aeromonas veronii]
MTCLITGLEVHRYAPELNKLHPRNRQTLPAPGITTIKEAKARLFSRWQPGHQVTITVSHPDYVNLSQLYWGRLANRKRKRPAKAVLTGEQVIQRVEQHAKAAVR